MQKFQTALQNKQFGPLINSIMKLLSLGLESCRVLQSCEKRCGHITEPDLAGRGVVGRVFAPLSACRNVALLFAAAERAARVWLPAGGGAPPSPHPAPLALATTLSAYRVPPGGGIRQLLYIIVSLHASGVNFVYNNR